jgi:hypothetical protein
MLSFHFQDTFGEFSHQNWNGTLIAWTCAASIPFNGTGSLSLEITPCLFNQTRQSSLPLFPKAPPKSWKTKFGIK